MGNKHGAISTYVKDNGTNFIFVTETSLSPRGNKAKMVEISQSGYDENSFSRQSRSRGGGIATMYKYNFEPNITFRGNSLHHNTALFLFVPPCTQPTKQSY